MRLVPYGRAQPAGRAAGAMTQTRVAGVPRIVVVGAGFAGLACVRRLEKRLKPGQAHILLVDPTSHSLYLPLLPQVASGVLAASSVAVPLARLLHQTIRVPGGALGVDLAARTLYVKKITGEDEDKENYIIEETLHGVRRNK